VVVHTGTFAVDAAATTAQRAQMARDNNSTSC
jgi:hypothetical protein